MLEGDATEADTQLVLDSVQMAARHPRDEQFTVFVRARGRQLLRAAEFLTADRHLAKDLLQVALTKTYVAWPVAARGDPYAYTRRVLVTSSIDMWRRRRWRERPVPDPSAARSADWQADDSDQVVERDRLLTALRALTARERSVVVLRYCEDLSERDVAAILNVSTGTVKSTASRALAKLRLDPSVSHPKEDPADAHI